MDRIYDAAQPTALGLLAAQAEMVSAMPRSLDLLRNIETTLSSLEAIRDFYDALSNYCDRETIRITKRPPKEQLDANSKIGESLRKAQVSLEEFHSRLNRCLGSALADPELREEDGVSEAYSASIETVVMLHNKLNTLRWTIGEHDADVAKTTGRFRNVEELIAHLNR